MIQEQEGAGSLSSAVSAVLVWLEGECPGLKPKIGSVGFRGVNAPAPSGLDLCVDGQAFHGGVGVEHGFAQRGVGVDGVEKFVHGGF